MAAERAGGRSSRRARWPRSRARSPSSSSSSSRPKPPPRPGPPRPSSQAAAAAAARPPRPPTARALGRAAATSLAGCPAGRPSADGRRRCRCGAGGGEPDRRPLRVGRRVPQGLGSPGFDCSGLTAWSWGQVGVACRTTRAPRWPTRRRCPISDLAARRPALLRAGRLHARGHVRRPGPDDRGALHRGVASGSPPCAWAATSSAPAGRNRRPHLPGSSTSAAPGGASAQPGTPLRRPVLTWPQPRHETDPRRLPPRAAPGPHLRHRPGAHLLVRLRLLRAPPAPQRLPDRLVRAGLPLDHPGRHRRRPGPARAHEPELLLRTTRPTSSPSGTAGSRPSADCWRRCRPASC